MSLQGEKERERVIYIQQMTSRPLEAQCGSPKCGTVKTRD